MVEQLKRMKLFKRNNNCEDYKFEDKGSTNESHYVFITGNENILLKGFVDSCASRHLTNQRHSLKKFKSVKSDSVNSVVQGSSVNIDGIWDITLYQTFNGKTSTCTLFDVGYGPNIRTNLNSLGKMQNAGLSLDFPLNSKDMIAKNRNEIIMHG